HVRGLDSYGVAGTEVGDEVVNRFVDRSSFGEVAQVFGEEIEVECVWVVPVYAAAFFERDVGEVAVIGVHVDERDGELFECFGDFARDGGLTASGSAGYSDNQWLGHAKNVVLAEGEATTIPKTRRQPKCVLEGVLISRDRSERCAENTEIFLYFFCCVCLGVLCSR